MAAYAALVSLMNTIHQIQNHPFISTSFDKKQVESLGETVISLLDSMESSDYCKEMEDLEMKISSAANSSEDVIEFHVVDQILAGSTNKLFGLLQNIINHVNMCDLQKVIEEMDSIKEKVENKGRFKDHQYTYSAPLAASSSPRNAVMVGFNDYLYQLKDKLTRPQSEDQVIPIVGMGGVGKTTLARNAFESKFVKEFFHLRARVSISQNYNAKEVLLELLSSLEGSDNLSPLNEKQLRERIHKCLCGRKYLIILDDMWSTEVWDDVKFFFPSNNNGSRIVVTTRLVAIARYINSCYLTIDLLDKDKSWNLFCHTIFGQEGCPSELEEVGKKICGNCKGLPLSIVLIGGFLRKSYRSREYWESIANDTYSILKSEGDNGCMNMLSLSYKHLEVHLKPCFLYMGGFAEDEEIFVSRLINLWVAEGFIRTDKGRSMEEVAKGYIKDLADRNLIRVHRWGSNGKIKSCHVHDLFERAMLKCS